MLIYLPPKSNNERQRRFQAANPGYDRRRKSRQRVAEKREAARCAAARAAMAQATAVEAQAAGAPVAVDAPAAQMVIPIPTTRLALPAPVEVPSRLRPPAQGPRAGDGEAPDRAVEGTAHRAGAG